MKLLCILAGLAVGVVLTAPLVGGEEDGKRRLRVGVYDSRAIAIAYAPSKHNAAFLKALRARHENAKAAGDEEAIRDIEAEAKERQRRFHLMGFGTAPVHELLEAVRGEIPAVAKEAGVELIVSKWEIVYRAEDAEVVDVTLPLVRLFEPSERTLGYVEQLSDRAPVPREELEKHED